MPPPYSYLLVFLALAWLLRFELRLLLRSPQVQALLQSLRVRIGL